MRYVASSYGSAGDFLPTLAVARALHTAGHEVAFLTNPFHERAVRRAGLEPILVGRRLDLYEMISARPDILRTADGAKLILDELAPTFVVPSYHYAKEMFARWRPDAVVGANLAFGLFWAAIERRVPSVMVSATPITWVTHRAPAQFLDFPLPARWLPYVAGAVRFFTAGAIDQYLWSVARTVGATSFDPSMTAIERGVVLDLGMWSEILRPPTPNDAANKRACGFARAGHFGATSERLPVELEAFLEGGGPPVVVGLGSVYSLGSDDLVADVAEACCELGERCVIVGPTPRGRDLPRGTLVVPYATYRLLFPRAKALVIHGGAGTTGEALQSGRPSVVVPLGFDQFGLAWSMEELGAGVRVPKRGRSRATLLEAVRRACKDKALRAGAERVGASLRDAPDGADVAASLIERVSVPAKARAR